MNIPNLYTINRCNAKVQHCLFAQLHFICMMCGLSAVAGLRDVCLNLTRGYLVYNQPILIVFRKNKEDPFKKHINAMATRVYIRYKHDINVLKLKMKMIFVCFDFIWMVECLFNSIY